MTPFRISSDKKNRAFIAARMPVRKNRTQKRAVCVISTTPVKYDFRTRSSQGIISFVVTQLAGVRKLRLHYPSLGSFVIVLDI